jgi:hypothetical protein
MGLCHACQAPWEGSPGSPPGKAETCVSCGADVHCCLNCRLYDPSAHNECRSRTTERVRDKDRRNHCDEFMFREGGGAPGASRGPKGDLDEKWKKLFG